MQNIKPNKKKRSSMSPFTFVINITNYMFSNHFQHNEQWTNAHQTSPAVPMLQTRGAKSNSRGLAGMHTNKTPEKASSSFYYLHLMKNIGHHARHVVDDLVAN